MDSTHHFELQAWNAPSILPRISLVLSRRRLTPIRMNFSVAADPRFCHFEFALECDGGTADRLRAQLARLVELVDVRMQSNVAMLHPTPSESDRPAAA